MRTARAKGVSFSKIIRVHAFRNALLPIITLIGLEIPSLLGGAVVTEQIFSWPGIGRLTMDSILTRDYPVLMCINMLAALMVLMAGPYNGYSLCRSRSPDQIPCGPGNRFWQTQGYCSRPCGKCGGRKDTPSGKPHPGTRRSAPYKNNRTKFPCRLTQ